MRYLSINMTVGLRVDKFFSESVGTGRRNLYDDQYYLYSEEPILGKYSKFVRPVEKNEDHIVFHPVYGDVARFQSVKLYNSGKLTILSQNLCDGKTVDVFCVRCINAKKYNGFMIVSTNKELSSVSVITHIGQFESDSVVRDEGLDIVVKTNHGDKSIKVEDTLMGWDVSDADIDYHLISPDDWMRDVHQKNSRFIALDIKILDSVNGITYV